MRRHIIRMWEPEIIVIMWKQQQQQKKEVVKLSSYIETNTHRHTHKRYIPVNVFWIRFFFVFNIPYIPPLASISTLKMIDLHFLFSLMIPNE